MKETLMTVRKKVEGEVEYNDGEFAEIQTNGIEGIEKDLLLDTIQLHREDSNYTKKEFQQRFRVGSWLDILTTTEIAVQPTKAEDEKPGKG
jgi:hypothetical protein